MRLGDYIKVRTGKLDANAAVEGGQYPFFTCSKENLKIDDYAFDCECVLLAGNGELNVKYYNGKFNAYQRTYVIEALDKTDVCTKYIYYFFKWYLTYLRHQSIGGVVKYIKLNNINDVAINLPSVIRQKEITDELEKIEEVINSCQNQINFLDELIKSLFVGKEVRS